MLCVILDCRRSSCNYFCVKSINLISHVVKKAIAAFLLIASVSSFSIPAFAGIDLNGGLTSFGYQGQCGPFIVTGASGDFASLVTSSQFITVNNIFAGVGAGGTTWMVQVADNSPDAVVFAESASTGGGSSSVDQFCFDVSTIMLDNPQNPADVDMGVYGYVGTGMLRDSEGLYNDTQATFTYFTEGSEVSGFSLDTVVVVPEPTNFLYGFTGVFLALAGLATFFRRINA